MRVLQKLQVPAGILTCAVIDETDSVLFQQFESGRTQIWSGRYNEPRGSHGFECDAYDYLPTTHYICLMLHGKVLGGCRLVCADSAQTLPIGEKMYLDDDEFGIEVSRFFLVMEECKKSGINCRVFLTFLVQGIVIFFGEHEWVFGYATIHSSLHAKLECLEIPMCRIGENHVHAGCQFVPLRLYVSHDAMHHETLPNFGSRNMSAERIAA